MKVESYHYLPSKDVILIPGKLYGPVFPQNIRFAFDPGAYRTIIKTELAEYAGYQANPQSLKISTKSIVGKEYGYTIIANKLSFLSFEFSNIQLACFDLHDEYHIDGLLGLDLLEKFEVTFRHRDRWIQFCLLDNNSQTLIVNR